MWQSWQNKILREAAKFGYKSEEAKFYQQELNEASMADLLNTMTPEEAEYILMGGKPSKYKSENPAQLKIIASKVLYRADYMRRQKLVKDLKAKKGVKEEVEQIDEATAVLATSAQVADFKKMVSAYFTKLTAKSGMNRMNSIGVISKAIDEWVKETKGDMSKLPDYFYPSTDQKTKFDFPVVNQFVRKVLGKFTIVNNAVVKEEVEQVDEAGLPTTLGSDYINLAKQNLEGSTTLAKRGHKEHKSQYGLGYRAYLRAFIAGNASKTPEPKDELTKKGWVQARKDLASLKYVWEELEVSGETEISEQNIVKNGVEFRPFKAGRLTGWNVYLTSGYSIGFIMKGYHSKTSSTPSQLMVGSNGNYDKKILNYWHEKSGFVSDNSNPSVTNLIGSPTKMLETIAKWIVSNPSKWGGMKKEEVEQVNEDAATILQQLGGNKFVVMTGAKNLMKSDGGKTLSFRLPKALNGINYVKITLGASDTYTVEFGRVSGMDYKVKQKFDNIYADQLQSIFTKTTGLYTKLF